MAAIIIGVDECGLGSIAGPVVVCAVAFPRTPPVIPGLTDSKRLTAGRRRALKPIIEAAALHWVIAWSGSKQIDTYGIARCKRACMKWATQFCLHRVSGHGAATVIVDGVDPIPGVNCNCVIRADATVPAVSAASVLAKVHRDAVMSRLADSYPRYGFDTHMGYPTQRHIEALRRYGACPIHRRSYGPVKALQ